MNISILGAAHSLPSRKVTSDWYDNAIGQPAGWAKRTTGVSSRRFVANGESASALAESAARSALTKANIDPTDLSAVIGACAVMEQPIPSFAVLLHRRLGLETSGIPAFDVNATCLSFLAALRLASLEISAGSWERVLITASDISSAAVDPFDPGTGPLFGDGAAAVVLGRGSGRLAAWRYETYSEGADATWLGAGGSRLPARSPEALLAEAVFRMDGQAAFRIVARRIEGFVTSLLTIAGWTLDDVDLVVPHQASGTALELMIRRLGLRADRVVNILAEHGNQVAASLPTALSVAMNESRLRPGSRVLLIGTGAGVSIAGAALEF